MNQKLNSSTLEVETITKCKTENIIVINKAITQCDKVRHLGGILDNSLQFKTHTINKC